MRDKVERYKDFSISCIIPMHNEKENAERVIKEAGNLFSELGVDWELIIIESGSTDNTLEKVKELAKGTSRIRVFHQDRKEGMGSALRLGYSKCSKDLIFHLEADSPFEVRNFQKALPIFFENDYVIGYRIGPKEKNFKWSYSNMGKFALLRAIYHMGYNLLLRLVFGLVVRDVNFSFKIFKRNHIRDIRFVSNGWFFEAEILLELKRKGIIPIEMPIVYKDRTAGQSTVNLFTPLPMFYEMARYIIVRNRKIR